jgi:dynein heavy chain, axonemal
MGAKHL